MQVSRSRGQVTARGIASVLVAIAAVAMPSASSALGAGPVRTDAQEEREKVQALQAEVASQLDTLRATDAEIEAALAAIEKNLENQIDRVAEAEQAVEDADQAVRDTTRAVSEKRFEIVRLEREIREYAIEAFIHPPELDALSMFQADDISDMSKKEVILDVQSEHDTDLLEQLAEAEQELEVRQVEAADAAVAAAEHRVAAKERLAELEDAREQQAIFAVEVQARLDRSLAEAAALADLDRQLAEQIWAEQAELAHQAAMRRAVELAAQQGGGALGMQHLNVSVASVGCPGGGSILVASGIAEPVGSLVMAAAEDGVFLCGGGYRSSAAQVALRQSHCGTSSYAVYRAPSSSCSPPTAPPGLSLHERGLAIDFTCNGGGAISSHGSPCFVWLAANAATYGLRNLPSEPWHWSATGQ